MECRDGWRARSVNGIRSRQLYDITLSQQISRRRQMSCRAGECRAEHAITKTERSDFVLQKEVMQAR